MTRLQDYARQLASPMELLGEVSGVREADLRLGLPRQETRSLLALADVYFGPTPFTRRQRSCRATKHCLATLKIIEKYVSRTKSKRDAWALRSELCATDQDVERLARTRLKEMYPPRQPEKGVRVTRRKGGPSTLSITGDSDFIADLHASINEDKPLDSVSNIFFRGEATARPASTTNIIIQLDELDEILSGGGEEITLRLTNGAEISGAKLVEKRLAECGLVTLVHPYEGPVNLYHTSRHASDKQRLMAGAENPTCPWAECNYPADKCQIHHLQAWKHGGETNMANLSVACPYHNGVNDDDPNAPPVRGRLERRRGRITWIPPWAR